MIIRVDIDNTICKTPGTDYKNSIPNHNRIMRINNLYMSGHTIIYWTSRGVGSGQNLRELTSKQLTQWGCLYHKLEMDKPLFDLFIDDKALNSNEYFYGV
ncbi:MAG: hypothetical protein WC979_01760 [Candidatus Pacearchaeota archaeon]